MSFVCTDWRYGFTHGACFLRAMRSGWEGNWSWNWIREKWDRGAREAQLLHPNQVQCSRKVCGTICCLQSWTLLTNDVVTTSYVPPTQTIIKLHCVFMHFILFLIHTNSLFPQTLTSQSQQWISTVSSVRWELEILHAFRFITAFG